jgi:hypothetical protein
MRSLTSSVAAEELVPPDEPKIAAAGNGWPGNVGDRRLDGARLSCAKGLDEQIDLAHVEADRLDVEVEFDARQRLQLLGQEPIIPQSDLRQPVIRDHEGPLLGLREMLEPNGRNFAPSQALACQQAAMPSDHIQIAVNQERDVEPKALGALGDLTNLLGGVLARVLRVRLQSLNGDVVDRESGRRKDCDGDCEDIASNLHDARSPQWRAQIGVSSVSFGYSAIRVEVRNRYKK